MSLEWFEFHPKSFITDTMRLNTEAKGAYLLLLLDYYEKEGPAPDDDDVLAAITGLSLEVWRRHRKVIQTLFAVELGVWTHQTCETVIANAKGLIAKKSEKARANALKRWNARRNAGEDALSNAASNAMGNATSMLPASHQHRSSMSVAEPDFGPSVTAPSHSAAEDGAGVPNNATAMLVASAQHCSEYAGSNATAMHSNINNEVREGATAPSSASVLSIGSLIDPAFMPSAGACSLAGAEGVLDQIGPWLDDWRDRCTDAGTRSTDWQAAWGREYDRRMKERAKSRPKPRVSVSRKPKKPKAEGHPMPVDWQLSPELVEFARKHHVDPHFIEQELRAYCKNPAGMYRYSDHDAAFRTFVLKRASNGQTQTTQRRAPAHRGSIVDAVAELDAELARRGAGGAATEDQPHGGATIYRLPQD